MAYRGTIAKKAPNAPNPSKVLGENGCKNVKITRNDRFGTSHMSEKDNDMVEKYVKMGNQFLTMPIEDIIKESSRQIALWTKTNGIYQTLIIVSAPGRKGASLKLVGGLNSKALEAYENSLKTQEFDTIIQDLSKGKVTAELIRMKFVKAVLFHAAQLSYIFTHQALHKKCGGKTLNAESLSILASLSLENTINVENLND